MRASVTIEEIFQKVRQFLAKKLKLKEEQIEKDSSLVDDVGVDSVDFWEIVAKVEQEFEIDIKDEDVKGVITVGDVVKILKQKIDKK